MEYLLISRCDLDTFNIIVNAKLKDGWILHGHHSMSKDGGMTRYSQTVVRSEEGDVKWINLEKEVK
jgi:hypothetical protein